MNTLSRDQAAELIGVSVEVLDRLALDGFVSVLPNGRYAVCVLQSALQSPSFCAAARQARIAVKNAEHRNVVARERDIARLSPAQLEHDRAERIRQDELARSIRVQEIAIERMRQSLFPSEQY